MDHPHKANISDAQATIEGSIISGLSERAHLTGATATHAQLQVPDILQAIFHPSVRWAVGEYLRELEQQDGANVPESEAAQQFGDPEMAESWAREQQARANNKRTDDAWNAALDQH